MSTEEVLKAVFPFLDGEDLASCMVVCKQWRDVARDDYYWKCACTRRWPSICKRPNPPTVTYLELYQTFCIRRYRVRPPRLSFEDLEFYMDIWDGYKLIFSEVVPGPAFVFSQVFEDYMMTFTVDPMFTIASRGSWTSRCTVSVLVGRKDSNRVACIINESTFYDTGQKGRDTVMVAGEYIEYQYHHPFCQAAEVNITLRFIADGNKDIINVFRIDMGFHHGDYSVSEGEVLWLLDKLLHWNLEVKGGGR